MATHTGSVDGADLLAAGAGHLLIKWLRWSYAQGGLVDLDGADLSTLLGAMS